MVGDEGHHRCAAGAGAEEGVVADLDPRQLD